MKTKQLLTIVALALLSTLNVRLSTVFAQGTAFTYQGHLLDNGASFTGAAEVQFTLWDASTAGNQIAATTPATLQAGVTNGLFTLSVDFGASAFDGGPRYLQTAVRTDTGPFETVLPRQTVTAVPYAVLAGRLNGLRIQFEPDPFYGNSPNLIGGTLNNSVNPEVVGATISGGGTTQLPNHVTGSWGTVGGGDGNIAGPFATVPGGDRNIASGNTSFAAGHGAAATSAYSFVWNSYGFHNSTVGEKQFGIFGQHGLNVDYSTQRPDGGGSRWVYIGDIFPPLTIATWNGASLSDGGVWQNASDRNRKTEFAPVDPQSILEKLVALPLKTWRYTNETSEVKHLGPMGQDFKAAFGFGVDEKTIGTVDADGVALAAIQGLNQKLEEQLQHRDIENAELKKDIAELKERVQELIGKGARP